MPKPEGSKHLERALQIFDEAVDMPPARRAAFLEEACAGDAGVGQLVEEMLAQDVDGSGILDRPVLPRLELDEGTTETYGTVEPPERQIGPYRLLRQIGQGGMGTVYLAMRDDEAFRRRVVVKLVRRGMESEDLKRRLRIERQILAGLDHPNIARIYDGGTTEDGLPYFVMEYVEGEAIDTYCDRNRLSIDDRLELFQKICSAVQSAHQNLVVHRDLKPSNILVAADGEPKLLDFGIAKLLNPELASPNVQATATLNRRLTPHYASPEQFRGQMITTASDVYSLGVLLYELLTGTLPFHFPTRTPHEIEQVLTEVEPERPSLAVERPRRPGESTTEQLAASRRAEPHELSRRLSGDLDAIVLKALRPVPRERYVSVEQLADDVERYLSGLPVEARRGTWRYRAAKYARRHRTGVALALVLMALPIAFAAGMAIMLGKVSSERDRVIAERNRVQAERDRAELEKHKKEVFLDWMLDLFSKSDPYVSNEEHARITVRQALDHSLASLELQAADNPELRAEVLQAIGVIYHNLGLYEQAEEQLDKALRIRLALFGENHMAVAQSESALARSTGEQLGDELGPALALAESATAKLSRLVGRSHPDFLTALNIQITVLCHRGDYRQAEPLAREALALSRSLGVEDVELVEALNNLATAGLVLEDYPSAADLYAQSVELQRSLYGSESPWLVKPLINLGVARRQLGQFDTAASLYREALDIQEQSLGADHPNLFATLFNLGRLVQATGEYREALDLLGRAADILRQRAGPGHPNLLLVDLRRQELHIELGETSDAVERLRALLAHWRPRLAEDHTSIALGESLLGHGLGLLDQDEEAGELLEASYAKLLAHGKQRHQREALGRLETFLRQRGLEARAIELRAMLEEPLG